MAATMPMIGIASAPTPKQHGDGRECEGHDTIERLRHAIVSPIPRITNLPDLRRRGRWQRETQRNCHKAHPFVETTASWGEPEGAPISNGSRNSATPQLISLREHRCWGAAEGVGNAARSGFCTGRWRRNCFTIWHTSTTCREITTDVTEPSATGA